MSARSVLEWMREISCAAQLLLQHSHPLFDPALLLETHGAGWGGGGHLFWYVSPSSAPSLSALRTKQWPLLHRSPRCQREHDPWIIYLAPHFFSIKWRPVSACPWSNLHFLISTALLSFKFACLSRKMDGRTDGGDAVAALALHVHHPKQGARVSVGGGWGLYTSHEPPEDEGSHCFHSVADKNKEKKIGLFVRLLCL